MTRTFDPTSHPEQEFFGYETLTPRIPDAMEKPQTFSVITRYETRDAFRAWDEEGETHTDVYEVWDKETGWAHSIQGEETFAEFVALDVGPREFAYFKSIEACAAELRDCLPISALSEGVYQAVCAKAYDMLMLIKDIRLAKRTDIELTTAYQGMREFDFALGAISSALDLHTTSVQEPYATSIWYERGVKGRHEGFDARYFVCSDTWYDEGDQVPTEGDEYHYPATLTVHVDPLKRIDFAYIPTSERTQHLHTSTASSSQPDGSTRVFDNQSLSIRIDLDDTAPEGIAVDIGRSPYSGDDLQRDGDLLGTIFAAISTSGSHEYRGMTAGMRDEFKGFAEQMSLQLHLQKREITSSNRRLHVGQSALQASVQSVA